MPINEDIFKVEDPHDCITICPGHRDQFGLRWRCGKVNCALPKEVAWHKSNRAKADRCINSSQSQYLVASTQQLIPVGSRKFTHIQMICCQLLKRFELL